jgi:hypothetical protein
MKLQHFGRWIFFRLQVKRKWIETLLVGAPGSARLMAVRQLSQTAQQIGLLSFSFLPEDERRSSFRNVILLKYKRRTKPKNTF